MREFKRVGTTIRMRLTDYEGELLASLVEQLTELLEAEGPQDDDDLDTEDHFDRWQAELDGAEPLDRDDPVIVRLFPDAYPDDPAASAEFRRLTQSKQRDDRHDQAEVVLAALADSDGGRRPIQVQLGELDAWLKTLTALRLSLAVRLGIVTAEDGEVLAGLPPDDPRGFAYRLYEWLGYLTENLLGLRR